MKILIWPNPKLKLVSKAIEQVPNESFVKELYDTMKNAGGVGISAIQVGFPERIFLLDVGNGMEVYVNPVLKETSGDLTERLEGCLSTPGQFEKVKRWTKVKVEYQDAKDLTVKTIDATELRAHAIQHELEHLDGKMYTDHLKSADRARILGAMMKLKRTGQK
jgi:peptide deformylase